MPDQENDAQNVGMYLQDLMLKRSLLHKMLGFEGAPNYTKLVKIDYGFAGSVREGDTVDPIP